MEQMDNIIIIILCLLSAVIGLLGGYIIGHEHKSEEKI